MNMKRTIVIVASLAVFVLLIVKIFQTRFWDSQQIEKSVAANIRIGDSEAKVVRWLFKSGIRYSQVMNADPSFARQTIVIESGLDAKQLSSLIVGTTREGILLGDLYTINIYFFFDKKIDS